MVANNHEDAALKYRHRVLGFLCLLSALTYLDRIAISVAGPRIQQDLGIGPELWGWVAGAFTISYALFEIPTGRMGDRSGARRVLTRVVLWWSAFTALTGSVLSFAQLVVTRFLFGAGEAGAYPNIGLSVARWFPTGERARAMGAVWMSAQLGGALTPLLIVPLMLLLGWRGCFVVLGLAGVAWCIAWYAWYRDTPAEMPGVSAAELAEIGHRAPPAHAPLPWGAALASANLRAVMLMVFCYVFALYFFISWLHTFLVRARGFSEGELLLSIAPPLFGACGNLAGGFLSDALVRRVGPRWGRSSVGVVSLSVAALCTVGTILVDGKLLTLLLLAFVYAGITMQQTVTSAVVLEIGGKHVGGIFGAVNMMGSFGGFVFSVSFGYFVGWFGSYDLALIPLAVMLAIAALAWLRVDATEPVFPP